MAESEKCSVVCGECGGAIDEPPSIPVEQRLPCPSCGSTSRRFHVTVACSAGVSSHAMALGGRGGEAVSFSESPRSGLASSASRRDDGTVDQCLVGPSPQGEEDTLAACQLLREHLNLAGANWASIKAGREPADCVLLDADDEHRALEVQVTRAIASQRLWKTLSRQGAVQSSLTAAEAASEMKNAIEAKCRKIPRDMRSKLVLALDATRLASLAFDSTVREFRSQWTQWAASQGFAGIWLVGPLSTLVWQLDLRLNQA